MEALAEVDLYGSCIANPFRVGALRVPAERYAMRLMETISITTGVVFFTELWVVPNDYSGPINTLVASDTGLSRIYLLSEGCHPMNIRLTFSLGSISV